MKQKGQTVVDSLIENKQQKNLNFTEYLTNWTEGKKQIPKTQRKYWISIIQRSSSARRLHVIILI